MAFEEKATEGALSPPMRRLIAVAAIAVCAVAAGATAAAAADPPAGTYGIGKTANVPITMDDGTVLRANVFYPTDASGQPASGPFPVVVSQTPYGKWLADQGVPGTDLRGGFLTGYEPYLVEHGYIAAVVDVRGTGNSDGQFSFFGDREKQDSTEVVDWASQLPRSTGKVGMTGASYLGIIQLLAAGAVGPDSPLKAIFPIVAGNDPYREVATSGRMMGLETDVSLLGLYNAQLQAGGFTELGLDPSLLGDPTLLTRISDHFQGLNKFSTDLAGDFLLDGDRAYDQDYWQSRAPANVLDKIVANGIPAYLVGTLWDVFQAGEPLNYSGLQNAWAGRPVTAPMSPDQPVTGRYQLLEKSEYHSTFFMGDPNLAPIQLAWFDHWLKGEDNGIDQTPTPMHLTDQTGHHFEASHYPLPQAEPTTYYLGPNATLDRQQTGSGEDGIVWTGASLPCGRATDQWSLGFLELVFRSIGIQDPCAEHDILPETVAPGRLTYTTQPFGEDTVLAGPIDATLFAKSNTPDSQWVVKVADVAPDGTATDLTQGALIGSQRALDEGRTWRAADGEPLMPWHPFTRAAKQPVPVNAVTRYDIDVRPTFATLPAGHRLQLTIQTGQTPHLIAFPADLPNLLGGVYNVQRTPDAASFLELPLAPASAFASP
jgi:uncharacterized protein